MPHSCPKHARCLSHEKKTTKNPPQYQIYQKVFYLNFVFVSHTPTKCGQIHIKVAWLSVLSRL